MIKMYAFSLLNEETRERETIYGISETDAWWHRPDLFKTDWTVIDIEAC